MHGILAHYRSSRQNLVIMSHCASLSWDVALGLQALLSQQLLGIRCAWRSRTAMPGHVPCKCIESKSSPRLLPSSVTQHSAATPSRVWLLLPQISAQHDPEQASKHSGDMSTHVGRRCHGGLHGNWWRSSSGPCCRRDLPSAYVRAPRQPPHRPVRCLDLGQSRGGPQRPRLSACAPAWHEASMWTQSPVNALRTSTSHPILRCSSLTDLA